MTRIAWKNHKNGALNPRAQFRKEVAEGRRSPARRWWRARSASSTARACRDGSAAAIIVRAEDALQVHRQAALREGAVVHRRARRRARSIPTTTTRPSPRWWPPPPTPTRRPASRTRAPELAMAEVHDCFTPTELVLMEDLGFAARGTAWKEVLAGTFDLDGELAVNPDGGLKSFGHPIGASGPAHAVRVRGCSSAARRASARSPASAAAASSRSPTTSAARRASACRSSAWSARSGAERATQPGPSPCPLPGGRGWKGGGWRSGVLRQGLPDRLISTASLIDPGPGARPTCGCRASRAGRGRCARRAGRA